MLTKDPVLLYLGSSALPGGTASSVSSPYVIIPRKGFMSPLNWQPIYSYKLSTSDCNVLLTS